MDFMDLARLVDKGAGESADRDSALLAAINEQKTQTALNTASIVDLKANVAMKADLVPIVQRVGVIEVNCEKRKEQSWADKTGAIEKLESSRVHWSRWVIVTLVGFVLTAAGCVGNVMLIRHFAIQSTTISK